VSALTELVAEFKALARQAWSIPSVERAKALEQCAAALESALAAERGGVDDATLGALDMAAKWVDATATASHKPSAKNLRAMIEAEGAFTRTLAAERAVGRECEMWRSIAEDLIGCTVYRDGTGMMPQSTSHIRASDFAAYVQRQMRDVLASLTPTPEASRGE
jgi:hypothetical protein